MQHSCNLSVWDSDWRFAGALWSWWNTMWCTSELLVCCFQYNSLSLNWQSLLPVDGSTEEVAWQIRLQYNLRGISWNVRLPSKRNSVVESSLNLHPSNFNKCISKHMRKATWNNANKWHQEILNVGLLIFVSSQLKNRLWDRAQPTMRKPSSELHTFAGTLKSSWELLGSAPQKTKHDKVSTNKKVLFSSKRAFKKGFSIHFNFQFNFQIRFPLSNCV